MEVGAVKQAFNNEVILLKKKLNQAKIQIIHKLTRKAKQLAGKKTPEHLNEKIKRKVQTAVNDVLTIKKIKPKDIAKFIVTHKGELKDFLNKPTVDSDKACARLLLHKALQDKYEFIRRRFSNVPIKDLFMSRLERRKMKKEAKEKQKNKKKGKDNKVVNFEGDWSVENIICKVKLSDKANNNHNLTDEDSDDHNLGDEVNDSKELGDDDNENSDECETEPIQHDSECEEEDNSEIEHDSEEENSYEDDKQSLVKNESDENIDKEEQDQFDDLKLENVSSPAVAEVSNHLNHASGTKVTKPQNGNEKYKQVTKKFPEKKQKELNRNKNFNEKIQQRKFKKDIDAPIVANKIVDPFFITSTGENYMSVVEPRPPDEIKAEHKKGNRKVRRAAMFGHVLKTKPRHDDNRFIDDNNRFSQNGYEKGNRFNNGQEFNNRQQEFNNRDFNYREPLNKDFSNRKRFNDMSTDEKPEKLHPSWEAKKRKSVLLPFEGKKIVFDS